MNKLKCNIPDHQQSSIMWFCYDQYCRMSSRLLCEQCICSHLGHKITTLNKKSAHSAIQNLRINHNESVNHPYARTKINDHLNVILNKFTVMFQKVDKFKQNCYINHLLPMARDINDSFREDGNTLGISKIIDESNDIFQINAIAKSIRCFQRDHLSNIDLLEQSAACMEIELSKIMVQSFKQIQLALNKVQNALNTWSLFEVKDYKTKLLNLQMEEFKKQQNQREVQENQKLQDFKTLAKQQGWGPITNWIYQGNKLSDMQQLSLIGKNNKMYEYPTNIEESITEIQGISMLINLKQLYLFSNQITKIENISNLIHLQILGLTQNRITKISGLQNLINLRQLYLRCNQITKIQNLQTLCALIWLDLEFNPLNKSNQNKVEAQILKKKITNCYIPSYIV